MAGALGVVITTDVPVSGQHAQPVYVDDSLPIVGPSQAIVVTTGEIPQAGGAPLAVRLAPAGTPAIGPALPVYVVPGGGALGVTVLAPVNSVLPSVSGTTELGQTLTTTNGTWTGSPSFAYQWYRNGVVIGGATNNTYVLVSADLGTTITSTVTATNAGGSTSATSAGTAILNWILLDRFTTAQAAPLTTPRTCDPGPGTLTLVDTANKLSTSGGRLLVASVTVADSDPRVTGVLLERRAGRVLSTRQKGAAWKFGFANTADATPRAGIQVFSSQFFLINNLVSTALITMVTTTDYDLLYIQSDVGAYMAVKGGAWATYTLLWPSMYKTANNKIGSQKITFGVNAAAEIDHIEEYDLGGIWSRSYGLATHAEYKPVFPQQLTATADLAIEVTWVMVGSSDNADLCIRYTDDNNCWIARLNQTAAQVQLIEKVAGVETIRVSAAQGLGATAVVAVIIRAEGQRISIGTQEAIKGSYATASSNQSAADVKLQASLSTPFYFNVWSLALPTLPTITGTLPVNIYPYGDSKTVGTGDDAIYGTLGTGYPWMVCEATEASRGAGCFERPSRTAAGGRTTAAARAAVDAELATKDGTPDYILYNLGANDVTALPAQATWETNTAYILDAMHTKWPNAHIYLMRVWVRGEAADCNTLATWQDNVLATRSAWAHAGPDERIFLENGDNGVTYTTDGIHPNHAGYVLTAAQWKAVIGI
jgi:lysophospholipase L1-like esterase